MSLWLLLSFFSLQARRSMTQAFAPQHPSSSDFFFQRLERVDFYLLSPDVEKLLLHPNYIGGAARISLLTLTKAKRPTSETPSQFFVLDRYFKQQKKLAVRQVETTECLREMRAPSAAYSSHGPGTHAAARRQNSLRAACRSRRYTYHVAEEDAGGDERRRHTLESSHAHVAYTWARVIRRCTREVSTLTGPTLVRLQSV